MPSAPGQATGQEMAKMSGIEHISFLVVTSLVIGAQQNVTDVPGWNFTLGCQCSLLCLLHIYTFSGLLFIIIQELHGSALMWVHLLQGALCGLGGS